MFLHIGADKEVVARDVITILNISTIDKSKITQEFLQQAKGDGMIQTISQDPPKSIIIAKENQKLILYLSPISSITLQKRIINF
ncbi:MAG: DUF370 domain-containing protein [Epulopiscium sp.]|nr:DUF370 domain-containing protein [Candidatus Epulonipiscium sp.]